MSAMARSARRGAIAHFVNGIKSLVRFVLFVRVC